MTMRIPGTPLPYGTPASAVIDDLKARLIAVHRGELRPGDIVLTVTDHIVSERVIESAPECERLVSRRIHKIANNGISKQKEIG